MQKRPPVWPVPDTQHCVVLNNVLDSTTVTIFTISIAPQKKNKELISKNNCSIKRTGIRDD